MPGNRPCSVGCECEKHFRLPTKNFHGTRGSALKRWAIPGYKDKMRKIMSNVAKNRSPEHNARISATLKVAMRGEGNPFYGKHHTPETKATLSKATAAWLATQPFVSTRLERALYLMLYEAGVDFRAQEQFGPYVVDAYDYGNNLAWEAFGSYWHGVREQQQPGYERRRRSALVGNFGLNYVVELGEDDLAPWLTRLEERGHSNAGVSLAGQ